MNEKSLAQAALQARETAYAPYSGFSVGAALLTADGKIYAGCNVENAAYSPGNCAERTAFFKAISDGYREFQAIAVAGGKAGEPPSEFCPPCGVCRQVMMEFCDPSRFRVILVGKGGEIKSFFLQELLPFGFGPASLK